MMFKKYIEQFPLKVLVLLFVVCQFTGQFYPFSKWTMYSSFPEEANVFYITDCNDEVVNAFAELNVHCAELKQRLNNKQAFYENLTEEETGILVLQDVFKQQKVVNYECLHLWELDLTLDNGHIDKTIKKIAQLSLNDFE